MSDTGWIYVLTNASMPGLVKVGLTTTSPEQRIKELSSATGVASNFELARSFAVSDVRSAEKKAHAILEKVFERPNRSREFFEADVDSVADVLSGALAQYLLVSEEAPLLEAAKLAYSKSYTVSCLRYEEAFREVLKGVEARLRKGNLAEHYGIYLGACVAANRQPIYSHLVSSIYFKSTFQDKAVDVLEGYTNDPLEMVVDFMRSTG